MTAAAHNHGRFAAERGARGPPGAAGGPPDPAAIAAVMRRHGLTPAPY